MVLVRRVAGSVLLLEKRVTVISRFLYQVTSELYTLADRWQ